MPTSPDPSKVTTADLAALADKSHLHDFEGHEGVQRLFQDEPSNPVTDALLALHDKGQHKELAEGCPACEAEKAAEMAEHPTAKKSAGASKKSAADKLAAAPTVKD